MMLRFVVASWLLAAFAVQAVEAPVAPGLLATALARPLLDQDPGVTAARAGLEVARQEAEILTQSPYEWTAKALTQRRTVTAGGRYGEWNVGIERGLRLPAKGAADRRLGEATVDEARARYGESVHDAARELMASWLGWLAAEQAHALAQAGLIFTQENLAAVAKRVRAGDASRLDANLASAELAEQRRLENEAKTQASIAWARLSTRFPGLVKERVTLPLPFALDQNDGFWRQRILSESDELRIVEAQVAKAEAQAEHERASRIPDPTLGVYTASEVGGRERISGITISIPLPGGLRAARSAKAAAAQEVAANARELKRRQLETAIAGELAAARGSYDSMQIAAEGAQGMQENAKLTQRAYSLGEGDLQTLLLARRQANAAAASALQAQLVALKAWYGLLVDAHLVWDLERD